MVFDKVKEFIIDQLGVPEGEILMETDLMKDLEADSLDLVELHMAFEEAANIKIPDEQLAKLATVGDIVEYLKGATA